MKKIVLISAMAALSVTACNNNSSSKTTASNADSTKNEKADTSQIATITHSFTNINATAAGSLTTIVDHYLHIKNALVSDDGSEAANGGKAMLDAINKTDKSLFTAEQKKVFDAIADDLKEHAEHIGSNGNNIEHQREHFVMMSDDMYDLVKSFGGGRDLYHDHCPMANDNKGAMWLSESRKVKNPYFAGKMNECVKVSEIIK
jgi:Protein of unknown function (DUF3347)